MSTYEAGDTIQISNGDIAKVSWVSKVVDPGYWEAETANGRLYTKWGLTWDGLTSEKVEGKQNE